MVFSSLVFIFVFLPLVISGFYLLPYKLKDLFLFFSSIMFFAWGGVSYTSILIVSIVLNFFFGLGIAKLKQKKVFLILGIIVNVIILAVFKYAAFALESLNYIFKPVFYPVFSIPKILLPIGISFYTFQAISYLIDVYRNNSIVQNNILKLGLYISLFPQLIAGPIVRYHDIESQLNQRIFSIDKFSSGILRFILGLGKKVIIANSMAVLANYVFNLPSNELSMPAAWIGLIAYTFQIYYDFSGYSDMAIGLGRMFGFSLLENFNFPYTSRSIREFWQRWHISLSNWFRDYLYIPLGGNRSSKVRTYLNLFVVFLVTGLWHGASWNYVLWGLLHGVLMIFERIGGNKIINRLPGILQNLYVMFFVMMAWVLFKLETMSHAVYFYKSLFDVKNIEIKDVTLYFQLNNELLLYFVIAFFGAFGFFQFLRVKLWKMILPIKKSIFIYETLRTIVIISFVSFVLMICTSYLVNNSYNPFIYFRF